MTFHAKSFGLEIFDVPIAPTRPIKELLDHYGKIDLTNIKVDAGTLNTTNETWEQEYEQLYK